MDSWNQQRQLRVIFWTQLFYPYIGGVEVLSSHFLQALKELGYEIIIVTSHGSLELADTDQWHGIPIYRFNFSQALATKDIAAILTIQKQLRTLKQQFQPDLIHINLTDPSPFFHLATQSSAAATMIVSASASLGDQPLSSDTLMYKAFQSATWVTANSQAILTELQQMFPPLVNYSSLIYNGRKPPAQLPLPLRENPPQFLCLGRVVEGKGFDLAITAFVEVINVYPQARLVIAGDGPARPELEQQVKDLGLEKTVEFVGWVKPDQVFDLINRVTVVIVPSRWEEAFGLVALEAALMARPVIASRVGGLPEVVLDGETGLVVENNNPQAIATAMIQLLDNLPQAKMMGEKGRTRAIETFSWQRYVESYHALYQRLCAAGS